MAAARGWLSQWEMSAVGKDERGLRKGGEEDEEEGRGMWWWLAGLSGCPLEAPSRRRWQPAGTQLEWC